MSTGESRLSQNLSHCCLFLVSGAGATGNPVFNLLFDPPGRTRTELNRLRKISFADVAPNSGLRQADARDHLIQPQHSHDQTSLSRTEYRRLHASEYSQELSNKQRF